MMMGSDMAGGYAVQTSGLTKRFGGRTVVDRVDLLVPVGVRLPGAQRCREDHLDHDAARADRADRGIDAAAGVSGPRRSARWRCGGWGRWPRSPGSWTT